MEEYQVPQGLTPLRNDDWCLGAEPVWTSSYGDEEQLGNPSF